MMPAGESILVTGAGRGLGLAMARRLGDDEATVWLADIRTDWAEPAAEKLRADGIDAHAVALDVA